MAKTAAVTKPSDRPIADVLAGLSDQRGAETRRLIQVFTEVSGFLPVVWGSIIGFGRYDYTYDSGHSGSMLATGFAPRRAELVLYIMPGYADFSHILKDLGKHRLGKSCLYLRKLDGVNETALRALIRAGLDDLARRWPVLPS